MAIIHVDETYPGLPNSGRLSGTNGDLVGIMDVALPLNGWSIEYSSGNARVYRPGSGNRFRLHMNDDSATSGQAYYCTVRGCENASSATTLVDPFPTVAQSANTTSNWAKSNAANTTARAFDIFVGETWVMYCVNFNGLTDVWDWTFFGDMPPTLAGDSYNTAISIRNTTSNTSSPLGAQVCTAQVNGTGRMYWARSYDATVKSTQGSILITGNSAYPGGSNNMGTTALTGPSTGVDMRKATLCDSGSTSTTASATLTLPDRASLPNAWMPLHYGHGALASRQTFDNSAYNPSALFQVFCFLAPAASSGFVVIETTDTWSPPGV